MTTKTAEKSQLQTIAISLIRPSKTNPRKRFDADALKELAASIQTTGLLQPIIVRPMEEKKGGVLCLEGAPDFYEIVAGERRWRACELAQVEDVLAIVSLMDDQQVLEAQVVENLQRQDVHPLEEAQGYKSLLQIKGFDAQRIADRVGKSAKYVYDRIKLLNLIEPLKKVFFDGEITAGHAVLLARLTPEQQKLAMNDPDVRERGLWVVDYGRDLFGGEEAEGTVRKAVSVRELTAWIEDHCRFDAVKADPVLFPETVETVLRAMEDKEKVIQITQEYHIPEDARDGSKVLGPRSWERADGKKGSKLCDFSVTGVIVIGEGRGTALKVCIQKEKCKTHWAAWQKEKAERQKQIAKGDTAGAQEMEKKRQEKAEAERRQYEESLKRWEKAEPAIIAAIVAAIKRASAGANGPLAQMLKDELESNGNYDYMVKKVSKLVPVGKSAEDFMRHVACYLLLNCDVDDTMKCGKALGVDVKKIMDKVAPADEPAAAKPEKKVNKKGK